MVRDIVKEETVYSKKRGGGVRKEVVKNCNEQSKTTKRNRSSSATNQPTKKAPFN